MEVTQAILLARIVELEETLIFMCHYTGYEGRPCALCTYENGKFIESCGLHKRIHELEAYTGCP